MSAIIDYAKCLPGCAGIPVEVLVGVAAAVVVAGLLAVALLGIFRRGDKGRYDAAAGSARVNQPRVSRAVIVPDAAVMDDLPEPDETAALLAGTPQPDNIVWVEAQIESARNRPGIYTKREAQSSWEAFRSLISDRKIMGQVMGDGSSNTTIAYWAGFLGAGLLTGLLLPAAFGGGGTAMLLTLLGVMPLSAFIGWFFWLGAIYDETYLPMEIRLPPVFGNEAETDVIVCWVRRLGLLDRPELLEGNQGRGGVRHKQARARVVALTGSKVSRFRYARDFYALPADTATIEPDHNTDRYALDLVAYKGGQAFAADVSAEPEAGFAENLRRLAPWLIPLAVIAAGLIILLAGGEAATEPGQGSPEQIPAGKIENGRGEQ